MSRLIDADTLWLDIIHAMDYCEDILEIIERQPTAEPQWIPCSDRLPEMKKPILVTYETEDGLKVEKTLYDRFGFLIGEAIAWMPLPEPYREEGDE